MTPSRFAGWLNVSRFASSPRGLAALEILACLEALLPLLKETH